MSFVKAARKLGKIFKGAPDYAFERYPKLYDYLADKIEKDGRISLGEAKKEFGFLNMLPIIEAIEHIIEVDGGPLDAVITIEKRGCDE